MGCSKKNVVFLCLRGLVGFTWGQNFLPSPILSLVFLLNFFIFRVSIFSSSFLSHLSSLLAKKFFCFFFFFFLSIGFFFKLKFFFK
jgi:hypothetical protein